MTADSRPGGVEMGAFFRRLGLTLCLACVAGVALAQEGPAPTPAPPPPEEPKDTRFFFQAEIWGAQPIGLQYQPVLILDANGEFQRPDVTMEANARGRYRIGYRFARNAGEFIGTYWSQQDFANLTDVDPTNFIFGESQVTSFGAGVLDDGFADGVIADTRTKTREFRLDFYRDAFETSRVRGRWFVGLRRLDHQRLMEVEYTAIGANLPIVIDPSSDDVRTDLFPVSDTAAVSSSWSGRGIEAGIDVTLAIHRRFWMEAGLALAAMRGRAVSRHSSTTWVFIENTVNGPVVLQAPFVEFEDPTKIPFLQQVAVPLAMNESSTVLSSDMIEAYLEFRCRAWKGLEAFAGFRNQHYENVGRDLGLTLSSPSVERGVGFEGYYAGLAYRF
jgi:hypothetical protein